MRIAGIIAEYDPFHKGHAAHITATRAENGGNATHIVAVISGSFTQRGAPALLNKFQRAEMALASGADLVLELPLPWAMAPAETFAAGGVAILNGLGCVDLLSFGSECGSIADLQQLAALPQDNRYQQTLRHMLSSGIPYAAAGQKAAENFLGTILSDHLSHPNNTLGIEYIRAATSQDANFEYFTLQRQGALHNENAPKQGIASASLLRSLARKNRIADIADYMPATAYSILEEAAATGKIVTETTPLEQALIAQLRKMTEKDFSALPWLSEGLENRLYRISRTATAYSDLLNALNTRRYPLARLRRILWAALLGLQAADVDGLPPYIRILGMNQRGQEILKASTPSLPVFSRTAQLKDMDDRCRHLFALECLATDLHTLCMSNPNPCGMDHTQKILLK